MTRGRLSRPSQHIHPDGRRYPGQLRSQEDCAKKTEKGGIPPPNSSGDAQPRLYPVCWNCQRWFPILHPRI